jgi:hypothetical protein
MAIASSPENLIKLVEYIIRCFKNVIPSFKDSVHCTCNRTENQMHSDSSIGLYQTTILYYIEWSIYYVTLILFIKSSKFYIRLVDRGPRTRHSPEIPESRTPVLLHLSKCVE